ncbi:MAG: hypothetical protein ACJAUV_001359 [Flavobacteriales bacterium]|jgi:hypothetical protein
MVKINVLFIVIITSMMSCKKLEEKKPDLVNDVVSLSGVFVVNEGNFTYNNASLSYVHFENKEISNQIVKAKTNEPLGDTFQSMIIHKEKAYLALDYSNKIEVMQVNSLEKIATISLPGGPRYMQVDEVNNTLWVTQYDSVNVLGLDLSTYEIKHKIDLPDYDIPGTVLPSGSDEVIMVQDKLYVTNFRRPFVYVINTELAAIVDSFYVGYGASSLSFDGSGVWVGTTGDLRKNEKPNLSYYNMAQNKVTSTITDAQYGFGNVTYDTFNNRILVLNNGVKTVSYTSSEINIETIINQTNGTLYYGLNVNPTNGDIWLTDAVDYVQQGEVIHYTAIGDYVEQFTCGYIPNDLVFY